jgi:sortase A
MNATGGIKYLIALLLILGVWQLGGGLYIHTKAVLAQVLLQHAWERTLQGEAQVRPWPWVDTWPVARLSVPEYGVDQIILSGTSGRTMAFGPGHLESTALPGRAGGTIVTGHRDTHFTFLRQLQVGDMMQLQVADGALQEYRVLFAEVIDQEHVWMTDGDDHLLILVTCYPFDAVLPNTPFRYQVVAEKSAAVAMPNMDYSDLPRVL